MLDLDLSAVPDVHMNRDVELVATQVVPEFREREEAHAKWRAERTADITVPVESTV